MNKEKILVSACLLGVNCKYNGGNNAYNEIDEFLKDYEIIPICPEIMGGLSTPRCPEQPSVPDSGLHGCMHLQSRPVRW